MPEIIAETTAAATYETTISTQNINQALSVRGDLGTDVIGIEQQNPDGSWSIVEDEKGLVQLASDRKVIGVYAAVGRIRINKPVTASAVAVWLGA